RREARDVGKDVVSRYRPLEAARCRAVSIWLVVSGCGVWISQPAGVARSPRVCRPWLVSSVVGLEVNVGSWRTYWMSGRMASLDGWERAAPGLAGPKIGRKTC